MAKVIIGGTEYEVPELNFIALERAWPFIEEAMTELDPMKGVSAAIHIIAAGLMEADHFDPETYGIHVKDLSLTQDREDQVFALTARFLKRKTKATEISGIREAVVVISREAGLEPEEGEDLPQGGMMGPPSPETLAPTSQNLLPQDARGAVGTE